MSNKKIQKTIVFLMLLVMLISTLLAGLAIWF
ncbi:stressosome-associated protein Prli42 [Priestia aryabhattai]|nr:MULTISPECIES: stressosome-associated protein Prli42 [Priestia]MBY0092566.1 stressosome-associated protein Prli42 [Priestia aryabhattai]MBY0103009.1 stressosome-associated protein Prli42 [Priestia aryabhattai]MCM3304923.1 stressosome-associated protein Prli42 [Priestia megaterium]